MFVNDSFSDPIELGIETGGTPYDYIPYVFSITYTNPGYEYGINID